MPTWVLAVRLRTLTSFRFIERAITVEIERQIDLIEDGAKSYKPLACTIPTKTKRAQCVPREEANDYRYFPDPDLLPVHIDTATFEQIKNAMPELPVARRERFQSALWLYLTMIAVF